MDKLLEMKGIDKELDYWPKLRRYGCGLVESREWDIVFHEFHHHHMPSASNVLESEKRGGTVQISTVLVQIPGIGPDELNKKTQTSSHRTNKYQLAIHQLAFQLKMSLRMSLQVRKGCGVGESCFHIGEAELLRFGEVGVVSYQFRYGISKSSEETCGHAEQVGVMRRVIEWNDWGEGLIVHMITKDRSSETKVGPFEGV